MPRDEERRPFADESDPSSDSPSSDPEREAPDPSRSGPNRDPASEQAPAETHADGPGEPRAKPLLARALNGVGIPTRPGIEGILDWIQVLAVAGLLAWGVMSFGIVRMNVPTGSMEPTIMAGDSFFVDKFSYLTGLNHPDPGDIIVFWHETNRQCREHRFLVWRWGEREPCAERFVKRLIAIGPATVTIRNGDVYVNGELRDGPAFDRDYVCGAGVARDPEARDPEGCSWEVPEDEMFVLGDNTRNSSDSRYWGTADVSTLIGEPFLRVWPPRRVGLMNGYFGGGH